MQKHKRVPTRVHTREIDRGVAKRQMRQIGIRQFCKHDHHGPLFERVYDCSYFANHWWEYCVGGNSNDT